MSVCLPHPGSSRLATLFKHAPSVFVFCLSLTFGWASPAFALSKPSLPVIFIHGIASDAGAWADFGLFLSDNGWNFGGFPSYNRTANEVTGVFSGDFYTLNFSNNQNLHFDQQGFELAAIIDAVLDINPQKSEVILVGHSMGGLAARAYLQALSQFDETSSRIPYREDVAKLITVGTPHSGADVAVICQEFPRVCEQIPIDPSSEAVEDLQPDSEAFDSQLPFGLNNLQNNPLPSDVAYVSIIGIGTNVIGIKPARDGDGIVTASSQNLSGLSGTSVLSHESKSIFIQDRSDCDPFFGNLLPNETHTCETTDISVWTELLKQFRQSSVAPSDIQAPDLTASITKAKAKQRKAGDHKVVVKLKVNNNGTAVAQGPYSVSLFLSADEVLDSGDDLLDTRIVNEDLAPGESSDTVKLKRKGLPPVSGFAIVRIDDDDRVAESDEENNILVSQLALASPKPIPQPTPQTPAPSPTSSESPDSIFFGTWIGLLDVALSEEIATITLILSEEGNEESGSRFLTGFLTVTGRPNISEIFVSGVASLIDSAFFVSGNIPDEPSLCVALQSTSGDVVSMTRITGLYNVDPCPVIEDGAFNLLGDWGNFEIFKQP